MNLRPAFRAAPMAMAFAAGLASWGFAQSGDSLPAFKADTATLDPFRDVEAGPSPWSAQPAAAPKTGKDSLRMADTVTERLRKRRPAVSAYLGIDFMDLDAKELFNTALTARVSSEKLKVLQPYESVHLAFPIGVQVLWPVSGYLDLVAKTHSYWYRQTAVLGDSGSNHAGEEWFSAQANLGGLGLRLYLPPSLLSVNGGLGLFAQGVSYWNLGNTELYSNHGSAPARFAAAGSGYEIQLGMQKAVTGSWQVSGAIGFLRQDFQSDQSWSEVLGAAAPAGKAGWGSSGIQATLNLWYRFGLVSAQAAPVPK